MKMGGSGVAATVRGAGSDRPVPSPGNGSPRTFSPCRIQDPSGYDMDEYPRLIAYTGLVGIWIPHFSAYIEFRRAPFSSYRVHWAMRPQVIKTDQAFSRIP